eukprot:gene23827-biopygen16376
MQDSHTKHQAEGARRSIGPAAMPTGGSVSARTVAFDAHPLSLLTPDPTPHGGGGGGGHTLPRSTVPAVATATANALARARARARACMHVRNMFMDRRWCPMFMIIYRKAPKGPTRPPHSTAVTAAPPWVLTCHCVYSSLGSSCRIDPEFVWRRACVPAARTPLGTLSASSRPPMEAVNVHAVEFGLTAKLFPTLRHAIAYVPRLALLKMQVRIEIRIGAILEVGYSELQKPRTNTARGEMKSWRTRHQTHRSALCSVRLAHSCWGAAEGDGGATRREKRRRRCAERMTIALRRIAVEGKGAPPDRARDSPRRSCTTGQSTAQAKPCSGRVGGGRRGGGMCTPILLHKRYPAADLPALLRPRRSFLPIVW